MREIWSDVDHASRRLGNAKGTCAALPNARRRCVRICVSRLQSPALILDPAVVLVQKVAPVDCKRGSYDSDS